MKLVKCPRCDLNYIGEDEKYCKICLREMKGESAREEMEMCSVCNASPALPGKDVCLSCHKEMATGAGSKQDLDETMETADEAAISMNSVSTMDEIIPQIHEDIPEGEFVDMVSELSLESVIEDEQNEEHDEEEE